MALDLFKNFAKVQVSTGYDAAATSIVLTAGHGTKLPVAPFNASWWNDTDFPDPSDDPNVEIVRVTAIASDTLTVTRGQESTSASTKNTASKTYRMIAGLTAKSLNTDLMSASTVIPIANGRLTLQSGVAVPITAQTAKTTIYFTPIDGNCITLYDGSQWVCHTFSEISLALGTLTADKNYDVFVYDNAGTLTLEFGTAWTSDIARADTLALQDGIYVKTGALTRRYLGTFRTTTTTTTEDSVTKRLVWNLYNAVPRDLWIRDTTSHIFGPVGSARPWNNDTNVRLHYVNGLALRASAGNVMYQHATAGTPGYAIFALDSPDTQYRSLLILATTVGIIGAGISIDTLLGYHYVQAAEFSPSGAVQFEAISLSVLWQG